MKLLHVDFGTELDHMSKSDHLLCISHEESLGYERRILVENLRFEQPVEVGSAIFIIAATLEVIRISIVNLFMVFVEDLKLHEVNSLLEKVHIAEVFNMEDELCARSIHLSSLIRFDIIWLTTLK